MAHPKNGIETRYSNRSGGYTKLTVRDVVEAIEKNGYQQISGMYVGNLNGQLAGCAIGQAAINLGVDADSLSDALSYVERKRKDLNPLDAYIIWLNDKRGKSTKEIAAAVREQWADQLDKELPPIRLGVYSV